MEALRCLKRRLSDAVYRQLVSDAYARPRQPAKRAREGTRGRLHNPARPTYTPRSSALRTSHNPDPQGTEPTRAATSFGTPHGPGQSAARVDAPEPSRWSAPPDERP